MAVTAQNCFSLMANLMPREHLAFHASRRVDGSLSILSTCLLSLLPSCLISGKLALGSRGKRQPTHVGGAQTFCQRGDGCSPFIPRGSSTGRLGQVARRSRLRCYFFFRGNSLLFCLVSVDGKSRKAHRGIVPHQSLAENRALGAYPLLLGGCVANLRFHFRPMANYLSY